MKKILCLLVSLILLLSISSVVAESDHIRVMVSYTYLHFDEPPMIVNDRTMVPMRAIFEALGMEVDWDNETQMAFAHNDMVSIRISIGSYIGYVEEFAFEIDAPAIIYNDRTFVPVRFIAEATGANVEWSETSRTVYINSTPTEPASSYDISVTDGSLLGRWVGTVYMSRRYYEVNLFIHDITSSNIYLNGTISTVDGSDLFPSSHPGFIQYTWDLSYRGMQGLLNRGTGYNRDGRVELRPGERTETTIIPGPVFGPGIVNLPREFFISLHPNDGSVGIVYRSGNFITDIQFLQRP